MSLLKNLWCRHGRNPLDASLKKCSHLPAPQVLLCWNRGLGDIPLGLYAFKQRVHHFLPNAEIFVLTRRDLEVGFTLLGGVHVLAHPSWKRYQPFDLKESLATFSLETSSFDLIFEHLNPTKTLSWQLGSLIPKLTWKKEWDRLSDRFEIVERECVGVHLSSETVYQYEKNWPLAYWRQLLETLTLQNKTVLVFGFSATESLDIPGVIDLRGQTNLLELLSLIKNHCTSLIAPDSGILSTIYYLDENFPLRAISLWADPRQGVLRQNVPSPNPQFTHIPLKAPQEDLKQLLPSDILEALGGKDFF